MTDQQTRLAVIRAIFDCSDKAAEAIGDIVRWEKAHESGPILHQGFEHDRCHLVVSGTADIKLLSLGGQDFQIATVEVGEMFGCYPAPTSLSADVHCRDELEYISMETSRFVAVVKSHAELGAGLAGILAKQLQVLQDRYTARLTLTANGRVYEQLLKLSRDDSRIEPQPVVAALAVRAQTTRETASRAISAAVRRGIIVRDKDALIIAAPQMLEDLVN